MDAFAAGVHKARIEEISARRRPGPRTRPQKLNEAFLRRLARNLKRRLVWWPCRVRVLPNADDGLCEHIEIRFRADQGDVVYMVRSVADSYRSGRVEHGAWDVGYCPAAPEDEVLMSLGEFAAQNACRRRVLVRRVCVFAARYALPASALLALLDLI